MSVFAAERRILRCSFIVRRAHVVFGCDDAAGVLNGHWYAEFCCTLAQVSIAGPEDAPPVEVVLPEGATADDAIRAVARARAPLIERTVRLAVPAGLFARKADPSADVSDGPVASVQALLDVVAPVQLDRVKVSSRPVSRCNQWERMPAERGLCSQRWLCHCSVCATAVRQTAASLPVSPHPVPIVRR
jgi:hypothetical protein